MTTSRDTVEEFLLSNNIALYPGSLRPRSDSFATAFPFFNSKLLSTLNENDAEGGSSPAPGAPSSSSASTTEGTDKRLRGAASTPDIKAIFDGPPAPSAYNYRPPEPLAGVPEAHAPQQYYPAQNAQAQQHVSPTGPGYQPLHTPRYHTPQNSAGSFSPAFVPSHHTRVSEEMHLSGHKRDSDPAIDDKLKDMVRKGVMGHHLNARAQSLDISRYRRSPSGANDPDAVGNALSQLRM